MQFQHKAHRAACAMQAHRASCAMQAHRAACAMQAVCSFSTKLLVILLANETVQACQERFGGVQAHLVNHACCTSLIVVLLLVIHGLRAQGRCRTGLDQTVKDCEFVMRVCTCMHIHAYGASGRCWQSLFLT